MNSVPLQPEALPTAGMLQSMSPGGGGVIPHSMTLIPSSPCLPPSGSSKTKASRSSSNGGSRKRHSPTPSTGNGGSSAKKTHQCMLVAAEAVTLKDAGSYSSPEIGRKIVDDISPILDDLPFGPEERRITRIDNSHRQRRTSSPRTPISTSKTSPAANNTSDSISSSSSIGGNINGLTSKLCHLNDEESEGSSSIAGALSHSATIDSSAQGMELGQGEIYNSWTSEGGIAILSTLTTR